jgi:hypothetical protein
MRLVRTLFRSGRSLAALLLLAAFTAGGVADARHHLSEQGCAADRGGRADHCVCASMHAAPLGSEPIAQPVPVEFEREFAPTAAALAPAGRTLRGAAPRGPPAG